MFIISFHCFFYNVFYFNQLIGILLMAVNTPYVITENTKIIIYNHLNKSVYIYNHHY